MAIRKRSARPKPLNVGDRVRAKTTGRVGEVTDIQQHEGTCDQLTVAYDQQPQDDYLTMPARDGVALPRDLVDHEQ